MAVFKCKMCGGVLDINNETVAICGYCGTQQTLPKLDDEKRAQLYDRANYFRRENEFDKAMGIYEMILSEEATDSEAYWGIVLCRYGIEYVEDPRTHRRIPTVNRAQFTSILDDEDYKKAILNADLLQKTVYESEAEVINKIQKGILAVSSREEPFDVFICYKETDSSGNRTQDSVYAQDIYNTLTKEGYKVFFSRITLEDKLGSAYEPYIFAALNSARVMLVIGTNKDNFNAVWVKNEWSRYLSLIESGKEKNIIPLYKDMSPYEMPEEFQYLQSQDMGKIGYLQDLVHGVNKLCKLSNKEVKESVVVNTANPQIDSLLKRGFMALEDGEWKVADNFFEQVLNQNAELAQAYLGKLMADLCIRRQENLKNCPQPFYNNLNYQKTIRFADEKLKSLLISSVEHIVTRNENARLNDIYNRAKNLMESATTEDAFLKAATMFESIKKFSDAEALLKECEEKAEFAKKDKILATGKYQMDKGTIVDYKAAVKTFSFIPGWKDADEQVAICNEKIEEITLREENERKEKEELNKETNKLIKKALVFAVAVIAFCVFLVCFYLPGRNYKKAVSYMEAEKYSEAVSAFELLGDYKDSPKMLEECKALYIEKQYNDAVALMESGDYSGAENAFVALNGYKDSTEKITECKYLSAIYFMETDKYVEAYEMFLALGDYKESKEKSNLIYENYLHKKLETATVGDTVFFGLYEQDNDISNGEEKIEWIVLETEGNKLLVISKYVLERQAFTDKELSFYANCTWEESYIREWLNNDFINSIFTQDEKAKISIPALSDVNTGNSLHDKLFLLSVDEAEKHFASYAERACTPSAYVSGNGIYTGSGGNCTWWLRSQGSSISRYAATVNINGAVDEFGVESHGYCGVRPAMWITVE